ncbi:MAG TPA: CPBP family intramembrane glutamic endopeptidase [Propionibacteriaceae bacterium]|nr:CPBP family intramembrane glutamic endopeptidase [Propionibacteriaceae bacterium]
MSWPPGTLDYLLHGDPGRHDLVRRLDERVGAVRSVLLAPPLRDSDGLADDSPMGWQLVPWRRHPVVRLVVFVAVVVTALILLGMLVLLVAPHSDAAGASTELGAALLGYAAVVRVLERRRHPLELLPRRWAGVLVGLGVGALLCALVVGLVAALGGYVVTGVDWSRPGFGTVWTLGVVAGVSEEIAFRGVLYRLLEPGLGTWGALATSAVVFGAIHLANPGATWAGALAIAVEAGVALGLMYALTRSLWVVVGVHAAWNVAEGAFFGVPVSGTPTGRGVLVSHPAGSPLLSGGGFGVEASLVSVVCWALVALGLGVLLVRRGAVVAPARTRHRLLPGNPPEA